MRGNYLIPANSKKSEMILGLFTPVDAIIFGVGVGLTVLMMFIFKTAGSLGVGALIMAPILIAAFLVFPIPNYHNVLQLIINIYMFYFVRPRRYKWRGWCYKNGNDRESK